MHKHVSHKQDRMKKAIIIGATSGIGNELAKILAENGYKVGITGRRKTELEKLQKSNPKNYEISSFDCTTENNSKKLAELTDQIEGLDLLVLSSGMGDLNEDLNFEIENKTNLLNVNAFTEIVDWTFNYFQKQRKGHLVAISSIAGIRGSRIAPAYNASKAYQINYLEGLRQKAAKTKKPIYVTDIRPGFVDTDMAKGEGQFWVATKEKAAKQIFGIIKQKKGIGYVTKRWWIIAKLLRLIPNRIYKKM
jgi:short-subunit dehydrogenase